MYSTVCEQKNQRDKAATSRKKRRQYFINKPFQLAVAGNMLIIVALATAVCSAGVSLLFIYVLNPLLTGSLTDRPYLIKMGVILTCIAAGVVFWTIRRTHAIAGPIDKTRKILREAAEGRFPQQPVTFRRGDAFRGLAEDLNHCLAAMQKSDRQSG
jgi:hypothetical protein